jgi:hypothetical protein
MTANLLSRPRRGLRLVAGLAVLAGVLAASSGAASVKPWFWTPGQAAASLRANAPALFPELRPLGVRNVSCTGLAPGSAGRFDAFACTATLTHKGTTSSRKAWLKVRHAGSGSACLSRVSLGKISAACLSVPTTGGGTGQTGSPEEAAATVRIAMQRRMDPTTAGEWRTFTHVDCTGSAKLYECVFGDDVSGAATIYYTGAGPVLYWTSLVCSPETAARYPAGCKYP